MKSLPVDIQLYNYVIKLANKKFIAPTSVYRSSWIVKEYKKRGGIYVGQSKEKQGLKRWFKEDWVDTNRPKINKHGTVIGYEQCGRKKSKINGIYPLCRPMKKISNQTPKILPEISPEKIKKANKFKQKNKLKMTRF